MAGLPRGGRLLLVTPLPEPRPRGGPWLAEVRRRTAQWRAALIADPRLRRVAVVPRVPGTPRVDAVRAELFVRAG